MARAPKRNGERGSGVRGSITRISRWSRAFSPREPGTPLKARNSSRRSHNMLAPNNSPLHHFTNPRGDVDGIMVQSPTALTMGDAMESVREVMRGRRNLRPSEPDNFFMETSESALAFMDK